MVRTVLAVVITAPLLLAATLVPAVQAQSPSLADERASARRSGLVLSVEALSAPMPPESANAAPLYDRYFAFVNGHEREDKAFQQDEALLESERSHSEKLSPAEWERVGTALAARATPISWIRTAARRPKCVFGPHEYVPKLTQDSALGDPYLFFGSELRSAFHLLNSDCLYKAHQGHAAEAIGELTDGFAMARQIRAHDTMIGYVDGNALDSLTVSAMRHVLRLNADKIAVCAAVQKGIAENYRPGRLSDALKIEAATTQAWIDAFRSEGPDKTEEGSPAVTKENFAQTMDAYGAFELQQHLRCIAVADAPYSRSAPILQAVDEESARRYPDKGALPNFAGGFWNAAFTRDYATNLAAVTRCAAAVLAFHTRTGKYPASLTSAMSLPPTDAVDGKPLHYEITGTGFVISATHQRPGHKPEVPEFRYPQ